MQVAGRCSFLIVIIYTCTHYSETVISRPWYAVFRYLL